MAEEAQLGASVEASSSFMEEEYRKKVFMDAFVCLILVLAISLVAAAWRIFYQVVWRPLSIQRALALQGIHGPKYRFLVGNMAEFIAIAKEARSLPLPTTEHNIIRRVMPHYLKWGDEYGHPYVYWLGYGCRIVISDLELCKEILSDRDGLYLKPKLRPGLRDLLANGLATLDGEKWAQHRRIINPAFFWDKLKAMVPTISTLADNMLDAWQLREPGDSKELDVNDEFRALAADVIAHTAFGSSYTEGKQVFMLQYEQQKLFEKLVSSIYLPWSRFLPTAINRYRWRLAKGIDKQMRKMILDRFNASQLNKQSDHPYGADLLGLLMAGFKQQVHGSQEGAKISMRDIIDECKTFFFAGHDTTSSLLMWSIMLLAAHPEWQERVRQEVSSILGTSHPTAEDLNHLRIVGMVLNETLRLYPPAITIFRETSLDVKLGNLWIPRGTTLLIPILALHLDPKYWGPTAGCFDPQRFADGMLKASTHPLAFIPFSWGHRNCVGQNFAMIEAKIMLCKILQNFRLHLSPGFKHEPTSILTLQSAKGVHIIFEKS